MCKKIDGDFDIGINIYILIYLDSFSVTIKKAKIISINLYRDMLTDFWNDNIFYEIEIDNDKACLKHANNPRTNDKLHSESNKVFTLIGREEIKESDHVSEEIIFKYNKTKGNLQLFNVPEYCIFSSIDKSISFFENIDDLTLTYREGEYDTAHEEKQI